MRKKANPSEITKVIEVFKKNFININKHFENNKVEVSNIMTKFLTWFNMLETRIKYIEDELGLSENAKKIEVDHLSQLINIDANKPIPIDDLYEIFKANDVPISKSYIYGKIDSGDIEYIHDRSDGNGRRKMLVTYADAFGAFIADQNRKKETIK